jgi:hypothetical protein
VLAHVHRLFDQVVQVLRDVRGKGASFKDPKNFIVRNALYLANAMLVTK